MSASSSSQSKRKLGTPIEVPKEGAVIFNDDNSTSWRNSEHRRRSANVSSPYAAGRNSLDGGRDVHRPARNVKTPRKPDTVSSHAFYGPSATPSGSSTTLNSYSAGVPARASPSKFVQKHANIDNMPQHRNASSNRLNGSSSHANNGSVAERTRLQKEKQKEKAPIEISISDSENEDEKQYDVHISPTTTVSQAASRSPEFGRGINTRYASSSQSPENARNYASTSTSFDRPGRALREGNTSLQEAGRSKSASRPFRIASTQDEEKLEKRGVRKSMKDRDGHLPSSVSHNGATKQPGRRLTTNSNQDMFTSNFSKSGRHSASNNGTEIDMPLAKLAFLEDLPCFSAEFDPRASLSGQTLTLSWTVEKAGGMRKKVLLQTSDIDEIGYCTLSESVRTPDLCKRFLQFQLKKITAIRSVMDALTTDALGTYRIPDSIDVALFGPTDRQHDHAKWAKLVSHLKSLCESSPANVREITENHITAFEARMSQRNVHTHDLTHDSQPRTTRPKPRPSVQDQSRTGGIKYFEEEKTSKTNVPSKDRARFFGYKSSLEKLAAPLQQPTKSSPAGTDQTILIYPFTQGSGTVQVFESDLGRLDEGEFLNDTIIAVGLKHLMEKLKSTQPELYAQIYVFSSFFYERLTSISSKTARIKQEAYERIKKWTKDVDLFAKKYLVVPINERIHWYLAIVVNPLYSLPVELREEYLRRRKERSDNESESKVRQSPSLPDEGEASDTKSESVRSMRSGDDGIQTPPDEALSLDKQDENERSFSNDVDPFGDESSARFQQLDTDGDVSMEAVEEEKHSVPVRDVRSYAWSSQPSDGISNRGQGKVIGGGDALRKRKAQGNDVDTSIDLENDDDENDQPRLLRSNSLRSLKSRPSPSPMAVSPHATRSRGNVDLTFGLNSSLTSSGSEEQEKKWRDILANGSAVCVFDSLNQRHLSVRNRLAEYLAFELYDKQGIAMDSNRTPTLEHIEVAAPKQPNYCDCGLYLLHTFDCFFEKPQTFLRDVIPKRDRSHSAWKLDLAPTRRKWWLDELKNLKAQWLREKDIRLKGRGELKRQLAQAARSGDEEEEADEEVHSGREQEEVEEKEMVVEREEGEIGDDDTDKQGDASSTADSNDLKPGSPSRDSDTA